MKPRPLYLILGWDNYAYHAAGILRALPEEAAGRAIAAARGLNPGVHVVASLRDPWVRGNADEAVERDDCRPTSEDVLIVLANRVAR